MTPEQTKSAYQRACEQECEWCARGYKIEIFLEGPTHIVLDEKQRIFVTPLCTAPSEEVFMERQAAQIAVMQAALAKAGHSSMCNSWDKLPCNCYLAALSDDVERGKELLGAVRERDEAVRAMDDGIRQNAAQVDRLVAENRQQAVEIEEWKSRLTGYEHMAKVRRFYEVCATLTGKDLETVAELAAKMAEKNHAAMKEKLNAN